MWYSACNFGYANKRLNDALKHQIDTLPQVASQYLHPRASAGQDHRQDASASSASTGRVHFNVGGAQAIEDSLKWCATTRTARA
jgi:4-aminobutyrate aminotransferase-like enzyme